jgi:hypothetical protein
MRRFVFLIFILSLFSFSQVGGQEIYRWIDEKGTTHFADDLTLVPEKYRIQFEKKKPPKESSSPETSQESEGSKAEPQSSAVKKDLQGRGEDWWRAKAKEWNDKLQNAQKNYDEASQAVKAKEQQREDSKSKPHSQRIRLRKESRDLEEKAKEREKELAEAKEMVEKVLPKQAEDYHADPDWLKPKEQGQPPSAPGSPPNEPDKP